jgi:stress response protein SCP2
MVNKILISGEKVRLNDYINSPSYEIHIQIDSSMTIDICCFGLDNNKQLSDDRYMIFYNQISSPENAISVTENKQRKTVFLTHVNKLPAKIKNLVFTATIDGNGIMSNISNGYLAIVADGREILRFDFSGWNFNNERAIIIAEIYFKEGWRLGAVAQGFNGGLSALLKHFGGEEIVDLSDKSAFKYYYNKLDLPLKKAYEAIVEGVNNFSERIHINRNGHIQESSISDLMNYIKLDNPSIFYLASNYEYRVSGNDIFFIPKYLFNKTVIQEMQNRLSGVIDSILKDCIKSSMNEYEKELVLHDYLVKNVVYDYDSLSSQKPPAEIYTVYGALINKKAVCSGYANAMKMLLDRCAIDCLIVTGDSKIPYGDLSVGHAWNIVKIDHKFYHLDVTWDAPINRSAGELFHDYFNITDTEILSDHKWDSNVPQCNSNEHNYFIYHGLNVNNDSALNEKLQDTITHKKQLLQFKYTGSYSSTMDSDKLNTMIGNIWQNSSSLYRQLGSRSLRWNISYNDRQKVFKVEFNYG